MLICRAVQISYISFFKRYRSILCGLGIAAVTLCLSPKASATTYYPTSVSCLSGSSGSILYQTPESDPVSPNNGNVATLLASTPTDPLYDAGWVDCTWDGFANVTSTSGMQLYFSVQVTPKYENDPLCLSGQGGVVSSKLGTFTAHCPTNGYVNESYAIPVGTNLSTISVNAIAKAHADGDTSEVDINSLYIQ